MGLQPSSFEQINTSGYQNIKNKSFLVHNKYSSHKGGLAKKNPTNWVKSFKQQREILGSIWFAHNPCLKTHISKLITQTYNS